jgi:hypothetical protein
MRSTPCKVCAVKYDSPQFEHDDLEILSATGSPVTSGEALVEG